jgi:hypothetical protein
MPTTLTTAIGIVSNALDDPNNNYWSTASITNWLNEGCMDIARRSQTLQELIVQDVVPLANMYLMPTNLISVHRIEFKPAGQTWPSNQTYPVVYRAINDMDQVWGVNQGSQSTYPQFYTPWQSPPNLTIQLFPVPAQSGTLNIYYYRTAYPATSGTDNLDVVEGFQSVTYLYAEYMALRKSADPRWRDAKELYEAEFQDIMNRTRTYTDQAGTFTTGGGWMPYWLYEGSDF